MTPLLEVTDLCTHFTTFGGTRVVKAVDGISFSLNEGETLGLIGESGCGKTTTCLSIVGLLPNSARIAGGRIAFQGEELTQKSSREMRHIRGRMIAMILQDPMASLNPLFSIYRQVAEPAYYHRSMRGRTLRERVQELLRSVRIPSPALRMRDYPHQMSGGMRQRIVGAIALAGGPKLIIADEPTTNLDVDDPGAVPRPAEGSPARYRCRDHLRHPQPGHRSAHVRSDGGDVRRQDRRARRRCGTCSTVPGIPTRAGLLGSIAKLGSKGPLYAIPGQPPNLAQLPSGCAFHPRCPDAMPPCAMEAPPETLFGADWTARCWHAVAQPAREEYDRASA